MGAVSSFISVAVGAWVLLLQFTCQTFFLALQILVCCCIYRFGTVSSPDTASWALLAHLSSFALLASHHTIPRLLSNLTKVTRKTTLQARHTEASLDVAQLFVAGYSLTNFTLSRTTFAKPAHFESIRLLALLASIVYLYVHWTSVPLSGEETPALHAQVKFLEGVRDGCASVPGYVLRLPCTFVQCMGKAAEKVGETLGEVLEEKATEGVDVVSFVSVSVDPSHLLEHVLCEELQYSASLSSVVGL